MYEYPLRKPIEGIIIDLNRLIRKFTRVDPGEEYRDP